MVGKGDCPSHLLSLLLYSLLPRPHCVPSGGPPPSLTLPLLPLYKLLPLPPRHSPLGVPFLSKCHPSLNSNKVLVARVPSPSNSSAWKVF